jgi:hypothetical protein
MNIRFHSAFHEAHTLYKKGRSYDAAVTYEQARQIAKEYALHQEAAKAGVWAAISWHEASRPRKALGLLMELLSSADEDLDTIDRWRVRKRAFQISHDYFPELEKLEIQFEKLKQFQSEYPYLPISDIHEDLSIFLNNQGKWEYALNECELAWSSYNDEGYLKYGKAYLAGMCNLYLNKSEAAQRWAYLLGQTDAEWADSRCSWHALNTEIALYLGEWEEAERQATQAENKADFLQSCESDSARFLRVRTLLLQISLIDPALITHSARFRLRQVYVGKPRLATKYSRALLVADYRLACVRYILGVEPVDDLWYRQSQKIPNKLPDYFKKVDFQERVKLANRSIRYAMIRAEHLDNCFQCTWRQEEVQQRSDRLNELLNFVNPLN